MYLLSYNGEGFSKSGMKNYNHKGNDINLTKYIFKFSIEQSYKTHGPSTELISSFLLALY